MSVCILAAGKVTVMAGAAFTLAWTHSVEKTAWQEDWRVSPAGLHVVEARIRGSGAGMEPPDDATLRDGWWVYRPRVAPVRRLVLAASGATVSGWSICAGDTCMTVGAEAGADVVLSVCDG